MQCDSLLCVLACAHTTQCGTKHAPCLLQDEKLLVHIGEEDLPDPFSIMVYLEELINNCSVTHLFTEEEKAYVINAIRSSVTHAGIDFCQDSAWVFFLRFVCTRVKECFVCPNEGPSMYIAWSLSYCLHSGTCVRIFVL